MNSHTHLPLVVDPSETLLMSGLFIFSSKHYYVHLAPSVFFYLILLYGARKDALLDYSLKVETYAIICYIHSRRHLN